MNQTSNNPYKFSWKKEVCAVFLYILLTLLLTYPYILKLNDHLSRGFLRDFNTGPIKWEMLWFPGIIIDSIDGVYRIAWISHALADPQADLFNANISHPNKNTMAFTETYILNGLIAFPIIQISKNPVLANNVIVLLIYIIEAFGVYLLIHYFIGNRFIAFAGGLMHSFIWFNYLYIQSIPIISAEWVPFVFLYGFKFFKEKKIKDAFLLLTFFLLQAFSAWYYIVFTTYSLAILFLLFILFSYNKQDIVRTALLVLAISGIALFILYPFAVPYFENQKVFSDFARGKEEPLIGSFYLDDYLFPEDKIRYVQYLLCLFLFIPLAYKKKFKSEPYEKLAKIFFISIACLFFFVSLGPRLKAFGKVTNIPLPLSLLFDYAPGFQLIRDAVRAEIVFSLCLSFLSCLGLHYLFCIMQNNNLKILIIVAVILIPLINFKMITNFSLLLKPVPLEEKIPEVYSWLKNLDKDVAIYETAYNTDQFQNPGNSFREALYIYYSIFHWKKIVNGVTSWVPPNYRKLINMEEQFPSEEFVKELKNMGTNYIIITSDRNNIDKDNNALKNIVQNNYISLIKYFPGKKGKYFWYVYEII